jgi:hypothetical protein
MDEGAILMAIRIGKYLFLGLVAGYFLAVTLTQWTWLEMRTNTALVIPVLSFLGTIWGLCSQTSCHKRWFWGIETLVLLIFLVLYRDPGMLTIIPAIMFKEAFNLSFLSLFQANLSLLLILIVGNLLWLIPDCTGRAHTGSGLVRKAFSKIL